jgi:hypothetical protein
MASEAEHLLEGGPVRPAHRVREDPRREVHAVRLCVRAQRRRVGQPTAASIAAQTASRQAATLPPHQPLLANGPLTGSPSTIRSALST